MHPLLRTAGASVGSTYTFLDTETGMWVHCERNYHPDGHRSGTLLIKIWERGEPEPVEYTVGAAQTMTHEPQDITVVLSQDTYERLEGLLSPEALHLVNKQYYALWDRPTP